MRLSRALTLPWLLLALALAACGGVSGPTPSSPRLTVVASIPPIADLVAQVGGQRVEVLTMVPPGSNPHLYEPTAAQMAAVSRARLLVVNGAGLEFWVDQVVSAAQNPRLKVLVLSEGMDLIQQGAEGQANPHLWLSPKRAMVYVTRIRDALIEVDPQGEAVYRARAAEYLDQLRALDAEIEEAVAHFTTREVIIYPAWAYFLQDYGLHAAAYVEPYPGKEPSPQYLAQVVETVKRTGARVVFTRTQFPPQAAETIAAETGAQLLPLDPLGGVPPREHYLDLMRWNLEQFKRGLGGNP